MLRTAAGKGSVIHPVVIVNAGGIKCRALLDSGAGSSYASAALEPRRIEMMMHTVNKMTEVHNLEISNLKGDFHLKTEVTKVDRAVLLNLENPNYDRLLQQYPHLQGITMDEVEKKLDQLPVHLILGTSEYAQIKVEAKPRLGHAGEPVAELTSLGWTIMSPGKEADLSNMFMTQTSSCDYEMLCRMDVLGLEGRPTGDQHSVYEDFKEQLARNTEGWYETGLPWRANHPPLPNNARGSVRRLGNLVKRLEKQPELMTKYDEIIQDQIYQGIVEKVTPSSVPANNEFYIPHKPVVRETAESSKVRVVYDTSAKAYEKAPSLNDCLETSVLTQNRFYPIAVAGDLKQAFLQVRVKEEGRNALKFHWLKDTDTKEIETLRFTRVPFGLTSTPFLLGGVIEQHLENCKSENPEIVEEIKRSLYVDDLIGGGETTSKAQNLKESAISIRGEACFELHKWHSNEPILETDNQPSSEPERSYAKEQLGVEKGETKLLGLAWDKRRDTIGVTFPDVQPAAPTKRSILEAIAKIYDPLGLVSPVTLAGKTLYREACDLSIGWVKPLPDNRNAKWSCWV
jgi:hypothetical protein